MDLTLTQTLQNFTNLRFIAPQCGGSLPSIEDRVLKGTEASQIDAAAEKAYQTRCVRFEPFCTEADAWY